MYLFKDSSRSPYFQIIYFVDGNRTTKSTRKKLKSEALKYLIDFEKNLEIKKQIKIITLRNFKKEYFEYASVYSIAYQRIIEGSFRQLEKSFPSEQRISSIDSKQIEKFIYPIFSKSQSSASLYLKTLKAAFSKAVEWEYIKSNPFNRVKLPKVKTKFPVFVNDQELNLILSEVNEEYLKSFYKIALNTGLRANELCSLTWKSIDFPQRIITVKNTESFTTKSKRERIIPMNEIVYQELVKLKPKVTNISDAGKDEYVLYRIKGVKLLVDFVSKKFKRACRMAKVNEGIHLHSLRHGFASQLVKKRVSLYVVKELLGHSNIKTTEIYSHLETEDLVNAVNQM